MRCKKKTKKQKQKNRKDAKFYVFRKVGYVVTFTVKSVIKKVYIKQKFQVIVRTQESWPEASKSVVGLLIKIVWTLCRI